MSDEVKNVELSEEQATENYVPENQITVKSTSMLDTLPTTSVFNPEVQSMFMRMANIYSRAGIAPQSYRNKPSDCYLAISMAYQMNVSPDFVMNNSYVVNGNFSWSGKACFSLIQACGKYNDLHYEEKFKNNKDFSIKLVGTDKYSGRRCESDEITWEMVELMGWADKDNSYWNKMPRQMARYRASAYFARAFCPDVLNGLYTADEQADIGKIYDETLEEEIFNG